MKRPMERGNPFMSEAQIDEGVRNALADPLAFSKNLEVTCWDPQGQRVVYEFIRKHEEMQILSDLWAQCQKKKDLQTCTFVLRAYLGCVVVINAYVEHAHMHPLVKKLLHMAPDIHRLINPARGDVTCAALRLLTALCRMNQHSVAHTVFSGLVWNQKSLQALFQRPPQKSLKTDAKTLFISFVMSLLDSDHAALKKLVLEQKQVMHVIWMNIYRCDALVIRHALSTLYLSLIDRSVPIELRRAQLSQLHLSALCKIYDTESSQDIDQFFRAVVAWASPLGTSHNVLRALLSSLDFKDKRQRSIAVLIFQRAPWLVSAIWNRFPLSLEPRASASWMGAISLAITAIEQPLLDPQHSARFVPSLDDVCDTFHPRSLTKSWYTKALSHDKLLIRYLALLLLSTSLRKAIYVLSKMADLANAFQESPDDAGHLPPWTSLAVQVRRFLQSVLPDPQVLISLVKQDSKQMTPQSQQGPVEQPHSNLILATALQALWLYHRAVPATISLTHFDFFKLPQSLEADNGLLVMHYSLRLMVLHVPTLSWIKAADFFSNALVSVVELKRRAYVAANTENSALVSEALIHVVRQTSTSLKDALCVDAMLYLSDNPDFLNAFVQIFDAYLATPFTRADKDKARSLVSQLPAVAPTSPAFLSALGVILVGRGTESSYEVAESIAALTPPDSAALLLKCIRASTMDAFQAIDLDLDISPHDLLEFAFLALSSSHFVAYKSWLVPHLLQLALKCPDGLRRSLSILARRRSQKVPWSRDPLMLVFNVIIKEALQAFASGSLYVPFTGFASIYDFKKYLSSLFPSRDSLSLLPQTFNPQSDRQLVQENILPGIFSTLQTLSSQECAVIAPYLPEDKFDAVFQQALANESVDLVCVDAFLQHKAGLLSRIPWSHLSLFLRLSENSSLVQGWFNHHASDIWSPNMACDESFSRNAVSLILSQKSNLDLVTRFVYRSQHLADLVLKWVKKTDACVPVSLAKALLKEIPASSFAPQARSNLALVLEDTPEAFPVLKGILGNRDDMLLETYRSIASAELPKKTPKALFSSVLSYDEEDLKAAIFESAHWLTDAFVTTPENTPQVNKWVTGLLQCTHDLPLKSFAIDPLVVAILTYRADVTLCLELCISLIAGVSDWAPHHIARFAGLVANNVRDDALFRRLAVLLGSISMPASSSSELMRRAVTLYKGTLTQEDQQLFALLGASEKANPGSTSGLMHAIDLSQVNADFMAAAWLQVMGNTNTSVSYDPLFLHRWLRAMLSNKTPSVSDWYDLFQSGLVGLVICSLASSHSLYRDSARALSVQIMEALSHVNFKEKDEILVLLHQTRNCIVLENNPLPSIMALFVARTSQLITTPESPIYVKAMRFFVNTRDIDTRYVPLFDQLLNRSSDVDERLWFLTLLRDGLVRKQDWRVLRKHHLYEAVTAIITASPPSSQVSFVAFQVLLSASRVVPLQLLSHYGILSFITSQRHNLVPRSSRVCYEIILNVSRAISGHVFETNLSVVSTIDALPHKGTSAPVIIESLLCALEWVEQNVEEHHDWPRVVFHDVVSLSRSLNYADSLFLKKLMSVGARFSQEAKGPMLANAVN